MRHSTQKIRRQTYDVIRVVNYILKSWYESSISDVYDTQVK